MKSNRGDRCLDLASETAGKREADYRLRLGLGCWELVYAGERAVLKDQVGLGYAAWLLGHPHGEPVHGVMLVAALRHGGLEGAPVLQERSLGRDDAEEWKRWRSRQRELERVLEDPDEPEVVKAEAERELEEVLVMVRSGCRRTEDAAQRTTRAVRRALTRLVADLEAARDAAGGEHRVLRGFGRHLRRFLLGPSSGFGGAGDGRGRAGVAGRFCYEPPEGVMWEF